MISQITMTFGDYAFLTCLCLLTLTLACMQIHASLKLTREKCRRLRPDILAAARAKNLTLGSYTGYAIRLQMDLDDCLKKVGKDEHIVFDRQTKLLTIKSIYDTNR